MNSLYTQAISISPKVAEIYVLRGFTYARKNDHDSAIADYARAIEIKSDYAFAYLLRGMAFARINNRPKAVADLKIALRLAKNISERQLAEQELKKLGLK